MDDDKNKRREHVLIGSRINLAAAVAASMLAAGPEVVLVSRPANYEPEFGPVFPRERNQTAPRSPKERFRKSSKR